jgi:hypothetical protein
VILNIRKTMTVTPRSVGMTMRILRIIKANIRLKDFFEKSPP